MLPTPPLCENWALAGNTLILDKQFLQSNSDVKSLWGTSLLELFRVHGWLSTKGIPQCLPENTVELFIAFPGNIILYVSLDPIPRQGFRNHVICVSSAKEVCQCWESYTDLRTKPRSGRTGLYFFATTGKVWLLSHVMLYSGFGKAFLVSCVI